MPRVTVSVPSQLSKKVQELAKKTGLKVSQIFRMALEEHLRLHYAEERSIRVRPMVLWKMKGRSLPRGPSPTMGRGRVGEYRFVSLNEVSV